MKKSAILMKLIKLFVLLSTVFISCNETVIKNNNHTDIPLNIYDSIVFDKNAFYPGIVITDYNKNISSLLGFDWNLKDIVLVNTKNKEIKTSNKLGNGPGEYDDIRGLSFFNDSTIILLSFSKVLFYDINGNSLKSKSLKFADIFQGYNLFKFNIPHKFNKEGDTILYIRHFNNNLERGKYKKIFWLTEVNLTRKSIKKCFKLDENNKLYSLDDYRFDRATPYYSQIIRDSLIYFLYPFEPVIYCYNANTHLFSKSCLIEFDINSFNAIKYKRSANTDKSFRVSQLTDYCLNFFITGNNAVILYSEGIPEDKTVKTRAEFTEKNIDETFRNEYLVFKDLKNGFQNFFKLRDEKNNKYKLLYVCSKNEVFLLKNSSENEETTFKIYIAKQ